MQKFMPAPFPKGCSNLPELPLDLRRNEQISDAHRPENVKNFMTQNGDSEK